MPEEYITKREADQELGPESPGARFYIEKRKAKVQTELDREVQPGEYRRAMALAEYHGYADFLEENIEDYLEYGDLVKGDGWPDPQPVPKDDVIEYEQVYKQWHQGTVATLINEALYAEADRRAGLDGWSNLSRDERFLKVADQDPHGRWLYGLKSAYGEYDVDSVRQEFHKGQSAGPGVSDLIEGIDLAKRWAR